mmetsp:Transcript_107098/g.255691  ORF Transcript_107098/g.255691 Transcript_107098/m.255691 type:complete len:310 (-) Transcript_107098:351-1280(-)
MCQMVDSNLEAALPLQAKRILKQSWLSSSLSRSCHSWYSSPLSFFTFFFLWPEDFLCFFSLSFSFFSSFGSLGSFTATSFFSSLGSFTSLGSSLTSSRGGSGLASSLGASAAVSSATLFVSLTTFAFPLPVFALLAAFPAGLLLASLSDFSFLSFLSEAPPPPKDLSLIAAMSISTPAGTGSGPLASAALRSRRTMPLCREFLSTPVPISMAFCMQARAPRGICRLSKTCAKVTKAHGQSGCKVRASRRSLYAPTASAFRFSRARRHSSWATSSGCRARCESSMEPKVSSIALVRTSAFSSRRIANFTR